MSHIRSPISSKDPNKRLKSSQGMQLLQILLQENNTLRARAPTPKRKRTIIEHDDKPQISTKSPLKETSIGSLKPSYPSHRKELASNNSPKSSTNRDKYTTTTNRTLRSNSQKTSSSSSSNKSKPSTTISSSNSSSKKNLQNISNLPAVALKSKSTTNSDDEDMIGLRVPSSQRSEKIKASVYEDSSSRKISSTEKTDNKTLRPVAFFRKGKTKRSLSTTDTADDERMFGQYLSDSNYPNYISKLSSDCLLQVFEFCKDFKSLHTISAVCQQWKSLTNYPSLWKDVVCEWNFFRNHYNSRKAGSVNHRCLEYVQSLRIKTLFIERSIQWRSIQFCPFKNLRSVELVSLYIDEIASFLNWIPHITTLKCFNVLVPNTNRVNLAIFLKLPNIQHLTVHFKDPCNLVNRFFAITAAATDIRTQSTQQILPTSLISLDLLNIFDIEEHLITSHQLDQIRLLLPDTATIHDRIEHERLIGEWNRNEENLVIKYSMLTRLPHLTSLSLNKVQSFTTRVWHECLTPIAENLTYLSLSGWYESALRESPLSHMRRSIPATATIAVGSSTTAGIQTAPDVDLALGSFICSLVNVKKIHLNDFYCSMGLVGGLSMLKRDYELIIPAEYKNGKDSDNLLSISKFLNTKLNNFTIVVK